MTNTLVVYVQEYITVFSFVDTHNHIQSSSMFPPSPPDNKLIADVINGYCDDITPESIKEDDCVCAFYTHSVI